MIESVNGSPLGSKATVTLQGVTYSLRYSKLAEYLWDSIGVNVFDFAATVRERRSGNLSTFLKLFSAMVAHSFQASHQPIPGPEYWAGVLDEEAEAKTGELCQAVTDCLLEKWRTLAQQRLREPTSPVVRPGSELQ